MMSEHYPIMPLGEVVLDMKDGGTPKRSVPENFGGDINWCVVKDIKPEIFDSKEKLTQQGLDKSSAKLWPANSIIISLGATIGKIGIARVPTATKQGLSGIVVNEELITVEFLVYVLHHKVREIQGLATGTTIKEVRPRKLMSELKIPVPPLEEQQRIVKIINENFAIIQSAIEDTNRNIANALDYFHSYLNRVFTELRDGLSSKPLSDFFDIGSSKRIMQSEWTQSGVPFWGGKEIVKLSNFGRTDSNAFISEEKYQEYFSKYDMPMEGDILMTARGTIGVGYIVKNTDKFYYKDGNIISFRAKVPTNSNFVLYTFKSNLILNQLRNLEGTTVRHLPIRRAKQLLIEMPSFEVQNKIVEQLSIVDNFTKKLGKILNLKVEKLTNLKHSILQEAFNGNLTKEITA
ncbi:restriction endonuclease subunit S [Euryarchaeota archaeon]|nr:restriction endonuclease subunit S [Euryarchaeota archaeon]